MEYYMLHLSPNDSKHIFTENTCDDFIVEFDKTITLPEESFVELMEIRGFVDERSRDTIYILSDICQNSTLFGIQVPVLRPLTMNSVRRVAQEFVNPYKIRVASQNLSRCRIYIRGNNLQKLTFDVKELEITLRLSWPQVNTSSGKNISLQ